MHVINYLSTNDERARIGADKIYKVVDDVAIFSRLKHSHVGTPAPEIMRPSNFVGPPHFQLRILPTDLEG